MNPNPFKKLLHSRKFWLVMLDTIISVLGLVVTQFFPESKDFVLALIVSIQPAFITLIMGITAEDVALTKAGHEASWKSTPRSK